MGGYKSTFREAEYLSAVQKAALEPLLTNFCVAMNDGHCWLVIHDASAYLSWLSCCVLEVPGHGLVDAGVEVSSSDGARSRATSAPGPRLSHQARL